MLCKKFWPSIFLNKSKTVGKCNISMLPVFPVETTDDLGFNVLHEAVLGGSADMIKHLSKGHAAPAKWAKRRKNVNGRTPMHLAAFLAGEKT